MRLERFLKELAEGTLNTFDVFLYDEKLGPDKVEALVSTLNTCPGVAQITLDLSSKGLTANSALSIVNALNHAKFERVTLNLALNYLSDTGIKEIALALTSLSK